MGRPMLARGLCQCGKTLPRADSKLCSRECAAISLSYARDKRQPMVCEQCNKTFMVKRCRLQPGKSAVRFCSLACRDLSLRKHHDFVCCKCGEQKTANDFFVDNHNPRGHVARCKACYAETAKNVLAFKPYRREESFQSGAKRRGLAYELTRGQFMTFWQKPCLYCGGPIPTIGLDRIDNARGYAMNNVVPCCSTCNSMKSGMAMSEFLERCQRIATRAAVSNSAITHGGKY